MNTEAKQNLSQSLREMDTKQKYDAVIGMIEACMPYDDDIVATEMALESLLIDLQTKYPIFSCVDSQVWFEPYTSWEDIKRLNSRSSH